MQVINNALSQLLSWDLFMQICAGREVTPFQANTFLSLLMQNGISFQTEFSPGNTKETPALQVQIYLNSITSVMLNITFGPGQSEFSK